MKATKSQVEKAILHFAFKYDKFDSYSAIIKTDVLPSVAKMIVVELFLNKFNPYFADVADFEAHRVIFNYFKELSEIGYVSFDK